MNRFEKLGAKKVLVTGATGFIGNQLVRSLLSRGFNVSVVVRDRSKLEDSLVQSCELVEADLVTRPANLAAAVEQCEVVFHLAATTNSVRSKDLIEINTSITSNILEAVAVSSTPAKFIYVSSLAAVGPSQTSAPVLESTRCKPVSNYGRSKLACERLVREYADRIPVSIVRPPIVLGPNDRHGLEMFKPIASMRSHFVPGFKTRSFSVIHVEDLTNAMILIAENGRRLISEATEDSEAYGEGVYFAAVDPPLTFADLGRWIGRALGVQRTFVVPVASPIMWAIAFVNEGIGRLKGKGQFLNLDKVREGLAGHWVCSNEKLTREFGFKPAHTLEERLRQTGSWYREQGWLAGPPCQRPTQKQHPTGPAAN